MARIICIKWKVHESLYDPRSEKIPDETHQADLELQGRIHDKFEALNRYEKIAFTYDNVVARKQFYVFRN